MKHPTPKIETIYRCSIYYEGRDAASETKISERVGNMDPKGCNIEDTSGGAAWGPYFIVEGESEGLVMQVANAISRIIVSYKGSKIHE